MNLIIATTPSGGIGYNNKLPWKSLEGDLKRFKDITTNKIVIMGSNTWKSLNEKPLPNRTNIVVSSKPHESNESTIFVQSIPQLLKIIKSFNQTDVFVIGGSSLINQLKDYIKVIYLTTSNHEYPYDTSIDLTHINLNYFPIFSSQNKDHSFQILIKKTVFNLNT